MNAIDSLNIISEKLKGVYPSPEDLAILGDLRKSLVFADWLITILTDFKIAETCFSLDEEFDQSEIGVELRWLSIPQIYSEAQEAQPGMALMKIGLIPIGSCLSGSGDPYFIRIINEDAIIFRGLHECLKDDSSYDENDLDKIINLSDFFRLAIID